MKSLSFHVYVWLKYVHFALTETVENTVLHVKSINTSGESGCSSNDYHRVVDTIKSPGQLNQ